VFPRVYTNCSGCVREDAVLKVKGRVERKEGLPRIIAMDLEELHLEPGPEPLYLYARELVGVSHTDLNRAFALASRYPGESPLFLVSGDGRLEEKILTVEDSSDLHAEIKQLLGARSIGYRRPERAPEMEQVS
jgi:DNA polymerase-3 subunit alpha